MASAFIFSKFAQKGTVLPMGVFPNERYASLRQDVFSLFDLDYSASSVRVYPDEGAPMLIFLRSPI